MSDVLAYFITFSTYGTWLHGRETGSVDRSHNTPGTPYLPASNALEAARGRAMRQEPYLLDQARRASVLKTILAVAAHRRWRVWAAHVRTNHVHVVVKADRPPEKVMADLKAWASRRLREGFGESAERDRWTQHGSTRWLHSPDSLKAAIDYTLDEQGERMAGTTGAHWMR